MPRNIPRKPNNRIAVLGLGAMGHAMAVNLVKADFWVVGYDVSNDAMQRFADDGGGFATTADEAVKEASIVLVMVSNSEQVSAVLFGPAGAAYKLEDKAVVIISSTVRPDFYETVTKRMVEEFKRKDVEFLDCPVSGGVAGAQAGTLSIFSSGSTVGLNVVKPVLEAMGSKIYGIPGGLGSGSKAKMCHQVLPEIDIALCAEAMAFAMRAGLNTKNVLHHVQAGDGSSWIVGDRVKYAVEGGQEARSVIPNSYKDSSIVLDTASKVGTTTPLVSIALQIYKAGIDAGWEKDDDSTLWRLYLHGYSDDAMYQHSLEPFPISQRSHDVEPQDIVDIFAGVHLAASMEAMIFTHAVGLDADIIYDIVSNAAGSNAQFVESVPKMRNEAPFLRNVHGSRNVCERLRKAVVKANSIGAPLPIASAALQLLLMDFNTPAG